MRIAFPTLLLALVVLTGCAGPSPGSGTPTVTETPENTPPTTDTTTITAIPTAVTETLTTTPTATARDTATRTDKVTPTSGIEHRVESILESGRAAVRISDENDTTLAVVNASIADEPTERFRGLSDATSLPNGTGMLFVYGEEDTRAFVMRDMAFPLDMVFVGANGTITTIHHAPTENDSDLTRYRGAAKWVLEVPYNWTSARGIDVGDSIEIEYPANVTVEPDS